MGEGRWAGWLQIPGAAREGSTLSQWSSSMPQLHNKSHRLQSSSTVARTHLLLLVDLRTPGWNLLPGNPGAHERLGAKTQTDTSGRLRPAGWPPLAARRGAQPAPPTLEGESATSTASQPPNSLPCPPLRAGMRRAPARGFCRRPRRRSLKASRGPARPLSPLPGTPAQNRPRAPRPPPGGARESQPEPRARSARADTCLHLRGAGENTKRRLSWSGDRDASQSLRCCFRPAPGRPRHPLADGEGWSPIAVGPASRPAAARPRPCLALWVRTALTRLYGGRSRLLPPPCAPGPSGRRLFPDCSLPPLC